MLGSPVDHLNSPILAAADIASVSVIAGWWLDLISHPIGAVSTGMAGLWYAICIFEAIEKRFRK